MEQGLAGSYKEMRQTIGWLGLLMPLILYLDTILFSDCAHLMDSISAYYFTIANAFFCGIFWAMALVLIYYPSYKNEPSKDGIITLIAGVFALFIPLFPTNSNQLDQCVIVKLENLEWRAIVHYSSAFIVFVSLSYMSINIFTRTRSGNDLKSEENKWKRRRNRIYIVSGYMTLTSILMIGLINIILHFYPAFPVIPQYTFWLEVFGLVPFGISWLIKGGFAFTDENERSTFEHIRLLVNIKSKK